MHNSVRPSGGVGNNTRRNLSRCTIVDHVKPNQHRSFGSFPPHDQDHSAQGTRTSHIIVAQDAKAIAAAPTGNLQIRFPAKSRGPGLPKYSAMYKDSVELSNASTGSETSGARGAAQDLAKRATHSSFLQRHEEDMSTNVGEGNLKVKGRSHRDIKTARACVAGGCSSTELRSPGQIVVSSSTRKAVADDVLFDLMLRFHVPHIPRFCRPLRRPPEELRCTTRTAVSEQGLLHCRRLCSSTHVTATSAIASSALNRIFDLVARVVTVWTWPRCCLWVVDRREARAEGSVVCRRRRQDGRVPSWKQALI